MKIIYLDCDGEKRLFSFFRHDYKTWEKDGRFYMIDGGSTTNPDSYSRFSRPDINKGLQEDEISNLIEDIREQFRWGKNYDKSNNRLPKTEYALLKDLETDHILGILKYFTEKPKALTIDLKTWKIIHLIFIEELLYRSKNSTL